jgi:hypothetical protein
MEQAMFADMAIVEDGHANADVSHSATITCLITFTNLCMRQSRRAVENQINPEEICVAVGVPMERDKVFATYLHPCCGPESPNGMGSQGQGEHQSQIDPYFFVLVVVLTNSPTNPICLCLTSILRNYSKGTLIAEEEMLEAGRSQEATEVKALHF